jgi:hypothetical protein
VTPVRWYHRWWWRLTWWWRAWQQNPRAYVHNSELRRANELSRRLRFTRAWLEKNATYHRPHHRDLLTGLVVALTTGLVTKRAPVGRPRNSRTTGRRRRFGERLVGRPVVYEKRIDNPSAPRVRITRVGETEWL